MSIEQHESHAHCDCHDDSCRHDHEHHDHHDACGCGHDHEPADKKTFYTKIISGGLLFVLGILFEYLGTAIFGNIATVIRYPQLIEYCAMICFALSYIIVAFSIVKEAIEGVLEGNLFNENILMTIASLGAFAIQEYSEGCAVMFLFTIGEFLQGLAVSKSKKSIRDMLEKKPQSVNVLRDGRLCSAAPEDVKAGDLFVVKPGEKIDLDGVITEGGAEVDMKALTGESIPVSKGAGDKVLAGSVNLDGALTIRAEKPYSESTVSRILAMIEDAEDKKSHAEQFITRFSKIYTPVVCLIALLIIVVPPLFFGGEWREWIYRGLSALVVSCPCALVISIPLGFFGGLGACSKEGILIKGGNYLETLAKCRVGVFDKTGTLTSGKFEFVQCECCHCRCTDKNEHRELLGIIAACEKYSTHPIAKSISLAFGHYGESFVVTDTKNYAGMGVSAVVDGVKYFVGNEKMMKEAGVAFQETEVIGTAVYCCTETEFLGDIVFADIIKEDSREAIARMHRLGMEKTVMLTGDKEPIARDVAKKAGVDEYYSKLLPENKVEKMKEIKKQGGPVLYTGDGINDAPVLAQADLGIAMGGAGSDIAIEASDMVIMGDSLSKIPAGIEIARKTLRIVHENIVFSIAVKLLIIIGCAVGIFNENAMWLAVFGDVGVCLIAIANSLRTLYGNKKAAKESGRLRV